MIERYYRKLYKKYRLLYPGNDADVRKRVNHIFLSAWIAGLLLSGIFFISSKGDWFYMFLGIWTSATVFTYVVEVSLERLDTKLLLQFGDFLTLLRHHYHETNMLDTALYYTLQELPDEIALHVQIFLDMVEDTDTTERVDRYVLQSPNRFFMTFSAICASIKEYGDKQMEGSSLFLTNLNYLKEELNMELLRRRKNHYMFSGLTFISLAPVFLLKPLQSWMTMNLPEMDDYYQGAGGMLSVLVTFLVSFVGYQMVCVLKDGRNVGSREYTFLKKLVNLPILMHILGQIENHNYSKTKRIGEKLRLTGNKMGTRAFLMKRVLYAVGIFLLCNLLAVFMMQREKRELLTDFANTFENSIVPNEQYRQILEETAKQTISGKKGITQHELKEVSLEARQQELEKEITALKSVKPRYAKEIAQLVLQRQIKLGRIYYHWWILLLAVLLGIGAYYIPYLMLLYQVSIMQLSMEDEVVQFQTLILILMYEDGVTLNVILDWMTRFAYCFKESLRKCVVCLERDQQEALEKLKEAESFMPFKRFVENLLSVDRAGIAGAFDEVKTEREYYKQKRSEDNEMLCNKKATIGKTIAFAPYICLISGHLLIPFFILAMKMFEGMMQILA